MAWNRAHRRLAIAARRAARAARPVVVGLLCGLVALGPTAALRADTISVGATTGAQIFFNSALTRTYNFGVTTSGAGLMVDKVSVNLKGNGASAKNVSPVVIQIMNAAGGTGTTLGTATFPAASLTTQFAFRDIALGTPLTLPAGVYSLRMTTANVDDYYLKDGKLQLRDASGTSVLSNLVWVEDSNTDGTAGTSFVAAGPVLAQYALATQTVNFGNFRLGATLSQNVQLSNAAIATSNNYTEALAGTSSTTGTATVSGVPSPWLSQGQATNLTIGLGSATAGPVSGNVNLSFTSVKGDSASPGPTYGTNVGTPTIAVSGTGYRSATAGYSTTSPSLGKFHVGATNVTGTMTLSNTQVSGQYSEGLAAASTATSGGASVVSGLPTTGSPLAAGSNATLTLGLASIANVGTNNTGTVTLGLSTSGTGTSGLAAESIGSQVITVSAQGYSGQSIWSVNSGGTWSSFDNWDVPGGLPGVDGSLSVADTATFGAGPTGATTVSLNGANPQLASLTFSTAGAAYTIAAGSGGGLTLGTSANTGAISVTAGSHTISTGLTLGRAATISTAAGAKLTISGALGGTNTLSKTGSGELEIFGSGGLSGATTVSAGTLRVNGSLISSPVTVQSGATLKGTGTVGPTTIASGGTFSPGNSPGTESVNGNLVWQGGGNYNWEISSATGGAGTGWDLIDIAGDLDLTNLSALSRFNVNLWSLASVSPDTNGNAANFNPAQAYSWTIARVTGSSAILGFDPNYFSLNVAATNGTGGFTNSLGGGSFSIEQNNKDLNIVFTPVPEPAGAALAAAGGLAALALVLRRRSRRPARP